MMLEMILAVILLTADPAQSRPVSEPTSMKSVACDFFTHDAAAKLLGQKAIGVDGGETATAQTRSWKCTFSAAENGDAGPKIYFMMLKSTSEDVAKGEFETIRQSNKKNSGFEEWPGVGDEAVVHADGDHFKFVMVRKGVKTIRVKINPAMGISLAAVKDVANGLVAKL